MYQWPWLKDDDDETEAEEGTRKWSQTELCDPGSEIRANAVFAPEAVDVFLFPLCWWFFSHYFSCKHIPLFLP